MDNNDKVLESLKVLVVEDAEDIRVLFSRLLGRYGATVATAKDGEDALQKMDETTFDITLMDLEMPNMDGMEAVIQLRKDGYAGKIVALSGHSWDNLEEALATAGFDGYLVKPIALEELVSKILYYCGRPQLKTNAYSSEPIATM
ncbi:MAG: response regulator [Bdellovibrionota bacterium]|nr:MAG: response regulator [Pseudomonadota bacterium]